MKYRRYMFSIKNIEKEERKKMNEFIENRDS